MRIAEHTHPISVSDREHKRTMRRQLLCNLALLLLVLGLGAACAAAYYHARGGFLQ